MRIMPLFLLLWMGFSSLSFAADELLDNVTIVHISNAEILEFYTTNYPSIADDIWEEGYGRLPDTEEFSESLIRYPVWGTWLIFVKSTMVGRIRLSEPKDGWANIATWIDANYRNSGVGTKARTLLYQHLDSYLGKLVVVETRQFRSQTTKRKFFNGIISEISIENYASLISQIRCGAHIGNYVGDGKRVSMLKLYFPRKSLGAEELRDEKLLELFSIEQKIMDHETRSDAILQLKALERGIEKPLSRDK